MGKHSNILQQPLCQQVLRKAARSNIPVWQAGQIDNDTYLVLAMRLGASPDNSKAICQMGIYHNQTSDKEN